MARSHEGIVATRGSVYGPTVRFALTVALVLASAIAGCGPSYPTRYVVERDVGHLSYRRYQQVLDVEFPVQGNDAVGHTATYVRRSERGEPPYVNVFVTVYDHPASLTAEVRHQVQSLESYDLAVEDVGGGRAWRLDGGTGDRWVVGLGPLRREDRRQCQRRAHPRGDRAVHERLSERPRRARARA